MEELKLTFDAALAQYNAAPYIRDNRKALAAAFTPYRRALVARFPEAGAEEQIQLADEYARAMDTILKAYADSDKLLDVALREEIPLRLPIKAGQPIALHEHIVCVPTLGRILADRRDMTKADRERLPASVVLPASQQLGEAFLAHPPHNPLWCVINDEGKGIAVLLTEAHEHGYKEADGGYVPDLSSLGIPSVPTRDDFERAGIHK